MIVTASKYSDVRLAYRTTKARAATDKLSVAPRPLRPPQASINIIMKRLNARRRFREWMFRALKEDGYFAEYVRREKALSTARQRGVARQMSDFKQNTQSDLEPKAFVPAREFFRWKQQDPDFWRDDNNLRSLRRSGAEFPIFNV